MRMVLVGGVPGAGKSTALASLAGQPGVRVLDPDRIRAYVVRRVPRVRYPFYRPLVHGVHQALVWVAILAGTGLVGAVLPGTAVLLVHDTATRRRRREGMVRTATARGWRPRLVLLDVTREDALAGQRARDRVVDADEFARHWRRWERLRGHAVAACPVHVVDRDAAVPLLRALVPEADRVVIAG